MTDDSSAPLPAPATAHAAKTLAFSAALRSGYQWEIVTEGYNLFGDYEITLEAPDRSATVIVRYRTKDSDR